MDSPPNNNEERRNVPLVIPSTSQQQVDTTTSDPSNSGQRHVRPFVIPSTSQQQQVPLPLDNNNSGQRRILSVRPSTSQQQQAPSPPDNNNGGQRQPIASPLNTRAVRQRLNFRQFLPRRLNAAAPMILQKELKSLQDNPLEGFRVTCAEENMFKWSVVMFGPPGTAYEGGYFKAILTFPLDFPFSPPTMLFTPPLFHPNIYVSGKLCISILHPPGGLDTISGETADEQWSPSRSVRSILLSTIAILNAPNPSSPANIDAAVSYRRYKNVGDPTYLNKIREQVDKSREEAQKDNVTVPETQEQYLMTGSQQRTSTAKSPDDISAKDSTTTTATGEQRTDN